MNFLSTVDIVQYHAKQTEICPIRFTAILAPEKAAFGLLCFSNVIESYDEVRRRYYHRNHGSYLGIKALRVVGA